MNKLITNNNYEAIAIVGLAKNAGKTVTFNTLVAELSEKKVTLGLVSFGRDGERIDLVTNKDKPQVFIPPRTLFVTAEKVMEHCLFQYEKFIGTGINTVLGEVNIYRSGERGGEVELVGINTALGLNKIRALIRNEVDLLLVDGAFDRRSSAAPLLTDGVILATGAVLGNTIENVVARTRREVKKLTHTPIPDQDLHRKALAITDEGKGGIIEKNGTVSMFKTPLSFQLPENISRDKILSISSLVLSGALTDSFLADYCNFFKGKLSGSSIIIKDGTKNFLSSQGYKIFRENHLQIFTLNPINLIALTANPFNPEGSSFQPYRFLAALREHIKEIPIFDVKSKEYFSGGGCTEK